VSVAGKKFFGKYNIFKMFNKFGTNFGKQVLCQNQHLFEFFLPFFSPFQIKVDLKNYS